MNSQESLECSLNNDLTQQLVLHVIKEAFFLAHSLALNYCVEPNIESEEDDIGDVNAQNDGLVPISVNFDVLFDTSGMWVPHH